VSWPNAFFRSRDDLKRTPDGPFEWATFQVGADRLVLDLRGPEPKLRADSAEVICIETKRQRAGKRREPLLGPVDPQQRRNVADRV
jgi:hypothetical protein